MRWMTEVRGITLRGWVSLHLASLIALSLAGYGIVTTADPSLGVMSWLRGLAGGVVLATCAISLLSVFFGSLTLLKRLVRHRLWRKEYRRERRANIRTWPLYRSAVIIALVLMLVDFFLLR